MDVKKFSEILTIAAWVVGGVLMFTSMANAAPDPNFHIYIAYGQSNMEGNAMDYTDLDKAEHPRVKMFATTSCTSPYRPTIGEVYPAVPPMFKCAGGVAGLSVADWFGRDMADSMPDVTIGIIPVAQGGTSIRLFDPDDYKNYLNSLGANDQWLVNGAKAYGENGNAMGRIIEVAKKAQEKGVIKGIIFHQGETDGGMNEQTAEWEKKVQKTYEYILSQLGLKAEETPFVAGEMVDKGSCYGFVKRVHNLSNYIANFGVASSKGYGSKGDGLHFTVEGYRGMGERYAQEMLKLIDRGPVVTTPRAPYGGTAVELPGVIEAENFDVPGTGSANKTYRDNDSENQGDAKFRTEDGVDIVEGGSGKAIGYTNAGEWLEYTINVKTAGKYKLTLNTASGSTTSSLQFSVDGTNITDEISIPQTAENKWDVYQEVDAGEVELKAGEQIIRLTITGSYVNVDWFKFEAIGSNGEVIEIIDPPSSSSGATTTPGSSTSKGSNDSKKEEAPEAIYAGNMHMGISTSSTYNVFDLKGQRLARFTARNMAEATQMWKNASMSASKIQGIVLIRNQHSGETVQVKSIR